MKTATKVVLIIWSVIVLFLTVFLGVITTKNKVYVGTNISIKIENYFETIIIETVNPTKITVEGISNYYFSFENEKQILSSIVENPTFKTRNELNFVLKNQEIYNGTWKVIGRPNLELKANNELKVVSKMNSLDKIGMWISSFFSGFAVWAFGGCFGQLSNFIYRKLKKPHICTETTN